MARLLVTGANGHVGSNLCRLLVDEGHDVVALVRKSSDLRGLEGVDVEYKHGDILDAESVRAAARGVQSVFNVAAVYATSGHSVEEIMRPAVEGVDNVLRAAAAEGVQRVVQTSTTGAIGFSHSSGTLRDETQWHDDPQTTYFLAKTKSERLAWQVADELDIDMVTVNPTAILGQYDYRITPSTKLVRGFLEGSGMTAQGGVNVVDVRDVARGHLLALQKGHRGERYMLVAENHELRDFASMVTKLTGIKVPHAPLPRWMIPVAIPSTGLLMRALGKKDILTVQEAREFIGRWGWFDPSKSKDELGFEARPTRETLDHTIRWLVHSGALSPTVEKRLQEKYPPDPVWN
jgi:dihydroflavonol-4-reductase